MEEVNVELVEVDAAQLVEEANVAQQRTTTMSLRRNTAGEETQTSTRELKATRR
jgi:hypothetical protein